MTDINKLTLDDLWRDAASRGGTFDPAAVAHLPAAARRYLEHAIAPGTPLCTAVRLGMEGEIRLKDRWLPFEAEQVIRWDRGLIWQARVRMAPLSIRGSDRFIDGQGAMRWKLLGLVPVMTADGPDISRSAVARLQAESMWVPAALLGDGVRWREGEAGRARVSVAVMGHEAELSLEIDERGRLLETAMRRWGNPGGGAFCEADFGGLALGESTFEGYTIPTRLRVGWHFGSARFESEGEFWRATITSATYR